MANCNYTADSAPLSSLALQIRCVVTGSDRACLTDFGASAAGGLGAATSTSIG